MEHKKVIDVFTYNGEADLLEIRLNILNDLVDEFIIIEAPTTFSGNPKPLYFENDVERFADWAHKIKYFVIDEDDQELWNMAKVSPNTVGAEHWKREFVQKESIKKALTHLNDEDIVFIGDVDEIWDLADYEPVCDLGPTKLLLRVYTYFLNNRSDERFYGTLVGRYKDIKNECLNHLRTHPKARTTELSGWHFTSMGGLEEVRRKLNDSYTTDSYNTYEVQEKLSSRFGKEDYIGRSFTFNIDESEWPNYLTKNKKKWKKLLA